MTTTADAGVFSEHARAAIYEVGHGRCIGCGRPDVSAQHRRARGMGGTSDVSIGHPANGVPLCGGAMAGVLGCHGWAERHPRLARLLGWSLEPGELALEAPFYDRLYGWRRWVEEPPGPGERIPWVGVAYVDVIEDLDRVEERLDAVARYRAARPLPEPTVKSQR